MKRFAAAALILAAFVAQAANKPNPYLSQAKVFYQGLEYEKCLARLEQATKWTSEPAEEVEVQLYSGLCNFNIGNLDEAKRKFDLALKLDPALQLPPYTSPRIADIFELSRARIAARSKPVEKVAEKAPMIEEKKAEPTQVAVATDAPKQVELTPAPRQDNSELITAAEGPSLTVPLVFGGTAALAAGAGAFFGLSAKSAEAEANDVTGAGRFESDAFAATNRAQSNAMLANVAFAVAGAAVIGAVISYVLAN